MLLVPVSSSNLAAIGYDPTAAELQVQFQTGAIYAYHNVPPEVYDGLVNASSKGTYFAEMIRSVPWAYTPTRIL